MGMSMLRTPTPARGVRRPAALLCLLTACLLGWTAGPASAEDQGAQDKAGTPATEAGRKNAIKGIAAKLRKLAKSPRPQKKKAETLKHLEALAALKGHEAGKAALGIVIVEDEEIRDRAFAIVEREHHKDLVKPLAAILEDKRFRKNRDKGVDIRKRVAHALAVMADGSAVEPLTNLMRGDEDAEVVAQVSIALGTYGGQPVKAKKEPVKRMIDVYTNTYTLMMSVRPEHKVLSRINRERWKVYRKPMLAALQSLTGQQFSRPQEWRLWWNKIGKKAKRWNPQ